MIVGFELRGVEVVVSSIPYVWLRDNLHVEAETAVRITRPKEK
jgi:hypothetical protein